MVIQFNQRSLELRSSCIIYQFCYLSLLIQNKYFISATASLISRLPSREAPCNHVRWLHPATAQDTGGQENSQEGVQRKGQESCTHRPWSAREQRRLRHHGTRKKFR